MEGHIEESSPFLWQNTAAGGDGEGRGFGVSLREARS